MTELYIIYYYVLNGGLPKSSLFFIISHSNNFFSSFFGVSVCKVKERGDFMRGSNVLFSHKSDEWSTPQDLFDRLDSVFHFTLDACASVSNHKCSKFYSIEDSGLDHDWSGEVVFCNPPYSNLYEWAQKCYFECFHHNCTVVFLVPARTDTKWFHHWVYRSAYLFFIQGRLKFNNSKNSAPFPSMVCVFKPYHKEVIL